MKRDWFSSFNDAASGLVRATRRQRNLRHHLLLAVMAVMLSLFLNISRAELAVIALVIGMVIMAELFNSAVEELVDLVAENYHPMAKAAKDIAAGAVLVSAGVAFTCGFLILAPKLGRPLLSAVDYVEKGPEYVTALALVGVVLLVVMGKAVFGKGQVLRGGMPSGHAAVSFAAATAVSFISENVLIILLTFLLAILVAQSRMMFRIHNLREVIVGGLLGTLFTVLVFQIMR